MKKYTCALTIGGSDASGGAGIQADLKTFSALHCYGMSAVTSLVAMNTKRLYGSISIDPEFVNLQLQAIYDDIHVDAVKTGMLYNKEVIETVAEFFKHRSDILIVDPVMIAKVGGFVLLDKNATQTLKEKLIPNARLITPNIPEAEHLLGYSITYNNMEESAKKLSELGAQAVLLKGGHLKNVPHSNDCLYERDTGSITWFESERIDTNNNHGLGCTLSAAITSFLAKGQSLHDSVSNSKKYLFESLKNGSEYMLGLSSGNGPVNHFYNIWNIWSY